MPRCPSTETLTQQSSLPSSNVQPRILSHKRRRTVTPTPCCQLPHEDSAQSATESCSCTTSGESSGDESDEGSSSLDEEVEEEEDADLVAAKRRRRADLDGLKKSVRRMEAQVVGASAQLKDLAALVAQVVAQRQLQWERL
uniref:Uncharacterized protein n=1 Tax=Peronospora matthiolae TaxID=2874970 RepID=A0AAV1UCV7_9STRA